MKASERPWFSDGLRFACTGCGACCRGDGYVWLDRREIRAIARYLALDLDAFCSRYLRRVGRRLSLIEKPTCDCIFFDDGCTIYPVRPRQCRTFPFWKSCIGSPETWRRAAASCEGIGSGVRYTVAEIEALAAGRGETRGPDGT